ncbi:hypothetical protein [Flavobacterium kingsejongi]|uniref:Lipoprotein n=1 Tax=Flavobacterium kingsejongi TaxID=1678728 RepID=A0A2S1LTB6_9FLAO|nr:hypothetical protein [Flavobacterium kingsejongi]AWG26886.1 hypothetical protein FK004_17440 [Flavobacterium kingsejongi]
MKTKNVVLGLAVIAMGFTSCKNETEMKAEKTVDSYEKYVDSVGKVAEVDAKANWAAVEAGYEARTAEAEAALENFKDKTKAQERLHASKAKYAELKAKYEAQVAAEQKAKAETTTAATGNGLRDTFFGGKLGEDMNFNWVNKDNILSVYQNFVDTFNKNKDSYSREDFDKIKTWYEALDAHKNKVEKEGLTSKDNLQIAKLKLEFAPKFKWERMTAKADENAKAKE